MDGAPAGREVDDEGAFSGAGTSGCGLAAAVAEAVAAFTTPLRLWAKQQPAQGETEIHKSATRTLEKILLDCALEATQGRKQDAARLLGWGRNTITRKLRELN